MTIVYRETSTSSKTRKFTMLTPKRVLLKKIEEDQETIKHLTDSNIAYAMQISRLNGYIKSLHRALSFSRIIDKLGFDINAPVNNNKQQTTNNIDAQANNNKQQTSNNPNTTPSLGYLIQTLTGTTPPKYIHEDIHLANAEAQRLAKKYNSSVRILEIIATIKPTTKQVPVTETIQTLEFQVSERMCELQNPNDDLPF